MTTKELDLTDDVIDVRDIIERVEELESLKDDHESEPDGGHWSDEDAQEIETLTAILEDLKGNGGDEQWRGDWYPVTLIRDSYFTDYIEELISDCYEMPEQVNSGQWPYRHITIDYEAAADEAKADYMEIEIDGTTYLYR